MIKEEDDNDLQTFTNIGAMALLSSIGEYSLVHSFSASRARRVARAAMVESLLWTSHHKGLTAEKGREFKRFVAGGGSGRHWAAAARERTARTGN